MTISYTGGEFIHQVETNDQQYSLKFDKIKVDQLSWVKVNKVIFSYEIFNNNNPSFIIYEDEQTYNNVKIIDGEWDISGLSIAIPSEEREVKLGVFLVEKITQIFRNRFKWKCCIITFYYSKDI